jgi:hypothetical protein
VIDKGAIFMELGNLIFGNSRGTYRVDRDWQNDFCEFLYECGFDSRGDLKIENDYLADNIINLSEHLSGHKYPLFNNGTFLVFGYYWGDDEALSKISNFIYLPSGYELSWYKYALRDSYANQNLSKKDFLNILDECRKSIPLLTNVIDEKIANLYSQIKKYKTELEKLSKHLSRFELRLYNEKDRNDTRVDLSLLLKKIDEHQQEINKLQIKISNANKKIEQYLARKELFKK